MLGNKGGVLDYLDLALFRLAKIGRKRIDENAELDSFYEEFFTENDDQVFNSGLDRRKTYKGRILNRVVQELVGDGGTVIDVGCGVGDNLKLIFRQNLTLKGLEYSANSLARAKKVLGAMDLRQGSAVTMPFDSNSADLIMCIEVLEHIPDQYQALREIRRVLKPEGVLLLSVPYRRWFPSYYTFMGHIRHYTREELQQLLIESGFDVVEWLPNYPRWHRLANYCYMFCRVLTITSSVFGRKVYPHELRFPFSKKRILDFLFDRIESIRLIENNANYASLDTSTFVLCKRQSSQLRSLHEK